MLLPETDDADLCYQAATCTTDPTQILDPVHLTLCNAGSVQDVPLPSQVHIPILVYASTDLNHNFTMTDGKCQLPELEDAEAQLMHHTTNRTHPGNRPSFRTFITRAVFVFGTIFALSRLSLLRIHDTGNHSSQDVPKQE